MAELPLVVRPAACTTLKQLFPPSGAVLILKGYSLTLWYVGFLLPFPNQ
jgi:hypothetical protein